MEEIQNSDQKFIVRERRCLKMPPPYNLEASWKEGNFRSSLLGQLHSSAKDRRGAFQAREAQGRAEACSGWGRGLRHRGQIGRAVVGRKVGQRRWRTGRAWGRVGLSFPEARWSATWVDGRRPRRLASSASAQIEPREMGAQQAEQPQ